MFSPKYLFILVWNSDRNKADIICSVISAGTIRVKVPGTGPLWNPCGGFTHQWVHMSPHSSVGTHVASLISGYTCRLTHQWVHISPRSSVGTLSGYVATLASSNIFKIYFHNQFWSNDDWLVRYHHNMSEATCVPYLEEADENSYLFFLNISSQFWSHK
jgi:hypothetical protein